MHSNVAYTFPGTGEQGFGVIEILISMFLIGLLAIAFLPVLITALQVSVRNTTIATATQLVAQELEEVGALGSSCTAIKAFAAVTPSPVADPQGALQPHLFLDLPPTDVCAAPYLRVLAMRIWITKVGSTVELANADTLILVDAE